MTFGFVTSPWSIKIEAKHKATTQQQSSERHKVSDMNLLSILIRSRNAWFKLIVFYCVRPARGSGAGAQDCSWYCVTIHVFMTERNVTKQIRARLLASEMETQPGRTLLAWLGVSRERDGFLLLPIVRGSELPGLA